MDVADLGGRGCQLAAFKILMNGGTWYTPSLSLVPVEGGYALRLYVKNKESNWLCAEKSGQVRVFKKADSAISLCRRLGVQSLTVDLSSSSVKPEKSPLRVV